MDFVTPDNCVGFLQEYCQKNNLIFPLYTEAGSKGRDHCKQFIINCTFENHTKSGTASTKKAAKKKAAKDMVIFLYANNLFDKLGSKNEEKNVSEVDGLLTLNASKKKMSELISSNPIGALQEYSVKNKLKFPVYAEVVGVSNQFTIRCTFENIIAYGSGSQKKQAKSAAAAEMWKLYHEKENKGLKVKDKTAVEKEADTTNVAKVNDIVKTAVEKEADTTNVAKVNDIVKTALEKEADTTNVAKVNDIAKTALEKEADTTNVAKVNDIVKTAVEKEADTTNVAKVNDIAKTAVEKEADTTNVAKVNDIVKTAVEKEADTTNVAKVNDIVKRAEVLVSENAEKNKTEDKNPIQDIKRFRDFYHKISKKDPEKWLRMICNAKNIDITEFKLKNDTSNTRKVFAIEVPSESINLEWDGNTEEEAKKQCCKIAGFILLMKYRNEIEYLFKNQVKDHVGKKVRSRGRETRSELKSFLHLENWLSTACQKSHIMQPVFKYLLLDGVHLAKCRLFLHTTEGMGYSRAEAKKMAVTNMQRYLLGLPDIKEIDDDIIKSQKVVATMTQVRSQLREEKKVDLDEVAEAYKKLTKKQNKPIEFDFIYTNGYSYLEGPSIIEILNLDMDAINNGGFKYIEKLVTEQNLILKTECFSSWDTKNNAQQNQHSNSDKSHYLGFIHIQRPDLHKLTFMGAGASEYEALKKATSAALVQLKLFLFKKSTQIENSNFLDNISHLLG